MMKQTYYSSSRPTSATDMFTDVVYHTCKLFDRVRVTFSHMLQTLAQLGYCHLLPTCIADTYHSHRYLHVHYSLVINVTHSNKTANVLTNVPQVPEQLLCA